MSEKKLKKKVKRLKAQNKRLKFWLEEEQRAHDKTWEELENLRASTRSRLVEELEDLAETSEAVEPLIDLGWNPDYENEPIKGWIKRVKGKFKDEV